jgi:hypothetical protein
VSQKQGQNGPQPQQPGLTPGDYRKHVLVTTQHMLEILQLETQVLQMKQEAGELVIDPIQYAHLLISSQLCSNLHQLAAEAEKQATDLTIVEHPKLVDQDGNPLSRPARRKIEKEANKIVPEVKEEQKEEVQA